MIKVEKGKVLFLYVYKTLQNERKIGQGWSCVPGHGMKEAGGCREWGVKGWFLAECFLE